MKKVLTILVVLTVIAGFAFATDINTVKLSTTIVGIEPVFAIKHSDSALTTKTVTSIAAGDVEASFEINQVNAVANGSEVGYSNHGEAAGTPISLTVTCGNFANNDATSANAAVISDAAYGETATGLTYGAAPVDGSNSVVFVPTYHGKRVDNQPIGSFTATWAQDNTLPAGTYTADITLAYTAL